MRGNSVGHHCHPSITIEATPDQISITFIRGPYYMEASCKARKSKGLRSLVYIMNILIFIQQFLKKKHFDWL